MPSYINSVALIGRLTRDPESAATQGGTAVCKFAVAVNGREKSGEAWEDRPDFFDVTVFGNVAEQCAEHLVKGQMVALDGRLRQDRWQTDGGDNRSKVIVIANHVQFLERPGGGVAEPQTSVDADVDF